MICQRIEKRINGWPWSDGPPEADRSSAGGQVVKVRGHAASVGLKAAEVEGGGGIQGIFGQARNAPCSGPGQALISSGRTGSIGTGLLPSLNATRTRS